MKSVKVTFVRDFTPGLDTLYTYKTASADVKPEQILWVLTRDGYKKVQVIHVDAVYDKGAEKKYGPLVEAFATKPEESTQPELPSRL